MELTKDLSIFGELPSDEDYSLLVEYIRFQMSGEETEEQYRQRLMHDVYYGTNLFDIGVYNAPDRPNGSVYYPFEIDIDGAPVDGSPFDVFETEEEAIECGKRCGCVYVADVFDGWSYDEPEV